MDTSWPFKTISQIRRLYLCNHSRKIHVCFWNLKPTNHSFWMSRKWSKLKLAVTLIWWLKMSNCWLSNDVRSKFKYSFDPYHPSVSAKLLVQSYIVFEKANTYRKWEKHCFNNRNFQDFIISHTKASAL